MENILRGNSTPAAERLLWQRGASDALLQKRYGIVRGARLLASGVPMADVVARTSVKSADIRNMFPAARRSVKAACGPGRTSTRDAAPAFNVFADAAGAATPAVPKRAAASCSAAPPIKACRAAPAAATPRSAVGAGLALASLAIVSAAAAGGACATPLPALAVAAASFAVPSGAVPVPPVAPVVPVAVAPVAVALLVTKEPGHLRRGRGRTLAPRLGRERLPPLPQECHLPDEPLHRLLLLLVGKRAVVVAGRPHTAHGKQPV